MIYGFVNDEVFQDPSLTMKNIAEITLKYGYLPAKGATYFVEPYNIEDTRDTRMEIFATPMTGATSITFDATKAEDEVDLLTNSSAEDMASIFNILEFVFFRVALDSTSSLDQALIINPTLYPNYVPDSIDISANHENVLIYDEINNTFPVIDWVSFSVTINGVELELKFWINNEAFLDDYPLSTISEIVPPLSPEQLVDPSTISGTIEAAVLSASLSATKLSDKIQADGYTDYISYPTKYINTDGAMVFIPFNILYKGAAPATLDIREAVKMYLLSLGIATEDQWKAILPDLFVEAQFFLIPMWDNITQRPDSYLYPSILVWADAKDRIDTILPDIEQATRDSDLEIIEAAYAELQIITCPDHLNKNTTTIRQEHKTYQRYSPSDHNYVYQEDHTKEFCTYLNRALATAAGQTTSTEFITNTFNERVYISFVVREIEYHVMTKASYTATIAEE